MALRAAATAPYRQISLGDVKLSGIAVSNSA